MVRPTLIPVREYVRQIHAGQVRKGGDPYIDHITEVEELCSQIFDGDEIDLRSNSDRFDVLAAALLHDSIEDTAADYEDVESVSNRQVADWVNLLSEDKRKPKLIRRHEYLEILSASCSVVQVIKLADVYSNVSGITFKEEKHWIASYLQLSIDVLSRLHRIQHLKLYYESQDAISAAESKLLY